MGVDLVVFRTEILDPLSPLSAAGHLLHQNRITYLLKFEGQFRRSLFSGVYDCFELIFPLI